MKMNKRIKRRLIFLLSAVLILSSLFSLASCKNPSDGIVNRRYDEAEVISEAQRLILESETLNEIYWGDGIPYVNDINLSNGAYYPAEEVYLEGIGVQTLEDLKNKTKTVFSSDMCDWIFESILSSVGTGTAIVSTARYAQKFGGADLDEPEYILVNKNYRVMLTDDVTYNYKSIRVLGSKGNFVTVSVDCTVTTDEGLMENQNIEIDLIEEKDGWRIATPTYTVYNGKK